MRVDDAMHVTRAAVEEGLVPGGGVALLQAIKALGRVGVDQVCHSLSPQAGV